jgi:hypothetical protein
MRLKGKDNHSTNMKAIKSWFTGLLLLSAALAVYSCKGDAPKQDQAKTYVCAYVWPSCHDDSLAHRWLWEEGIGEWEVIKQ